MKNRLELKILLLIILVLIVGFGTYVIVSINRESKVLLEQQREKARLFSETVMVGIRNVMLSGKAPYAAELVSDARENLLFGTLRVYDNNSKEVFPDEGRGIISGAGDLQVRKAIESEMDVMFARKDSIGEHFVRIEPLMNERECQQCHSGNHTVRGVTRLTLNPELMTAHAKDMESNNFKNTQREVVEIISNTLAASFRNIMLAGQGELMDTLVRRTARLPFIEKITVYDRFGAVHFGEEENLASEASVMRAIENEGPIIFSKKNNRVLSRLIPFRNEERCQVCHGSKSQWRGVMEVSLRVNQLKMKPTDLEHQLTEMLQATIGVGFRSIMLVGKGSYARAFINDVRKIGAVQDLRVFDKDANERFVNSQLKDHGLKYVNRALLEDSVIEAMQIIEEEEFLVRYAPLRNEKRCQVCHGDDHTIRGVVGVTTSMAAVNATIADNQFYSLIAGGATILLVWLVLRIFMKVVVVKPIDALGNVVREVGNGNFSVSSIIQSNDEIGELGTRINEMIIGLRERFHLEKFVSKQTVDYVQRASEMGVKLGGERKVATVFFSDVRGFTAFSEKVEPEKVVAMLNSILSRQATIVKKFGGDIDKYVGDELVAVFQGEQMVQRTVQCSIEIQQMMRSIPEQIGDDIAIGIGINTGEMIMGAMGSEDRMDFTVIGDAVNLGARLCSAAGRGQIIVSEFSAKYLQNDPSILLTKLEPIKVKGKELFIQIFEAAAQ
ncbi:MAG: adenylate/guanylate cyclase domain-containing protein [Bacteriovoracaceae bacterium]